MRINKMVDLITSVIVSIFGILATLTILGFAIIRHRSGKPRFETQDYFKSYKRNDDYSRSGNPFKSGSPIQNRNEQRMITAAIIGIALVAVVVSLLFDVFEGLLVIFLLPIVVRFIRIRNEANSRRNTAQDGNRSSY